ncbi:MAG TPA: hypothetical protein VFQ41_18125 [Candidatus Angelobacter sp.]|nr:hypothetical protein [Candidatus Angelobacter sp.]
METSRESLGILVLASRTKQLKFALCTSINDNAHSSMKQNPEMTAEQKLLKHFMAAIAYREQKALGGAPESFAEFSASCTRARPINWSAHDRRPWMRADLFPRRRTR